MKLRTFYWYRDHLNRTSPTRDHIDWRCNTFASSLLCAPPIDSCVMWFTEQTVYLKDFNIYRMYLSRSDHCECYQRVFLTRFPFHQYLQWAFHIGSISRKRIVYCYHLLHNYNQSEPFSYSQKKWKHWRAAHSLFILAR